MTLDSKQVLGHMRVPQNIEFRRRERAIVVSGTKDIDIAFGPEIPMPMNKHDIILYFLYVLRTTTIRLIESI